MQWHGENNYTLICNSRFANRELTTFVQSAIMKSHRGMRPHDIVILLKIAAKGQQPWMMKDLSRELEISASEVSESLNRSAIAGLISQDKKRLMKGAILDFLAHGLPYVYPESPGGFQRGVASAHSAPPLNEEIRSEEPIVWPHPDGQVRGLAISPLHPMVPYVIDQDPRFYELMALVDALRIGKARERQLALEAIKERIG